MRKFQLKCRCEALFFLSFLSKEMAVFTGKYRIKFSLFLKVKVGYRDLGFLIGFDLNS